MYTDAWIVPGGGIDEGETKLDALKREILEETGLIIQDSEVTPIDEVLTGQSEKTLKETNERVLVDMMFYNYTVRLTQPAAETTIVTEDDWADAEWIPVADLAKYTMSPPTRTTLQHLGYLN